MEKQYPETRTACLSYPDQIGTMWIFKIKGISASHHVTDFATLLEIYLRCCPFNITLMKRMTKAYETKDFFVSGYISRTEVCFSVKDQIKIFSESLRTCSDWTLSRKLNAHEKNGCVCDYAIFRWKKWPSVISVWVHTNYMTVVPVGQRRKGNRVLFWHPISKRVWMTFEVGLTSEWHRAFHQVKPSRWTVLKNSGHMNQELKKGRVFCWLNMDIVGFVLGSWKEVNWQGVTFLIGTAYSETWNGIWSLQTIVCTHINRSLIILMIHNK